MPADREEQPVIGPLHVLLIEDSSDDAELLIASLQHGGFDLIHEQVETEAALRRALAERSWDIVFSDYSMPRFNALEALKVVKEYDSFLPFVIISGAIGEETAVEAMRAGAHDYFMKDNLVRLPSATKRLLAEATSNKKRQEAEEALRASEELNLRNERMARAEAERLCRSAESANRMKDEFLATLSHELRTPLSAILGHSELLMDEREALSEDVAESIAAIHRNALTQLQLISDLLDVSRIISGKLSLDVRSIDVAPLLTNAVATIEFAAKGKGIVVDTKLEDDLGSILGDAVRVQQVIWNLLSNAVKFTPNGGRIEIAVRRLRSQLEIDVRDSGFGIDPEFLPFVFERFRQEDGTTTRKYGGLGLGLAIVRYIVEAHGGTVHASSEGRGKGSVFSVRLPIRAHYLPESESSVSTLRLRDRETFKPQGKGSPLAGIAVLVVDDEEDARSLTKTLLKRAGANVFVASSVRETKKILAAHPVDVLFCDIGMPEEDGYLLIGSIRYSERRENRERLPAVALTAYAAAHDREKALASGFDAYLTKPVEPATIIRVAAKLAGLPLNEAPREDVHDFP